MMLKLAFVAAAAALALAALAVPAAAQSGNAVKGRILTDAGKPVPLIVINIEAANGTLVGQTTTNNEGEFYFGGLGGGTYLVVVSEIGYQPVRERVEFVTQPDQDHPGENQFVHISLTSRPGASPVARTGTVFAQSVPPPAKQAYDRGVGLSKENKPADAVAAYREAVAAFPDYFDAHFALASELIKTNSLPEAMGELDRANKINPKDARVYATFGLLLARQRKYSVAAAAFGEASRLSPAEPQYPLMRATVLIDEASLVDQSKPELTKTRTELLATAGRDLDKAFELSGRGLATVHLQRARLFERQGDRKRAADVLEAFLKQVPNAPNAAAIRESVAKLRSGK